MPVTRGHNAVIRFVEETTPGTTPTDPAFKVFGRTTKITRWFKDRELQELVDIGNDEVDGFFSPKNAYGFEVEYDLYTFSTRVQPFLDRDTEGAAKSFSLEYIPSENAATKHYYRGTGWRPQTVNLSSEVGAAWTVKVVFVGGKWADPVTVDPGVGLGSRESRTTIAKTDLKHFASGAVQLDAAAWAVLLGSFEVEFSHGSEARYTTGDADPVAAGTTFSKRRISGSADFSLDDGASDHHSRVDGDAASTITIPFGVETLTISGVRFGRVEVESGTDTDLLEGSQPFMAESFSVA